METGNEVEEACRPLVSAIKPCSRLDNNSFSIHLTWGIREGYSLRDKVLYIWMMPRFQASVPFYL